MAEKNLGDLRTKFKLDTESIDKLAKSVKGVRGDFEWLSKNLTQINTKLDKTLKALQGIQKAGGLPGTQANKSAGGIELPLGSASGNTSTPTIQANSTDARQAIQNITINQAAGGAGGMSGGMGGGGGRTAAAAMQVLNAGIQALDNRINNNYQRSLGADKLGVYYQQNKGITNNQYYHQMREPLQNQRLGYGGIDTLLSLQASTGIEASKQAGGIAGLRAVSGYSYSTGDMANMVNTLGSAQVNNRMTMMLGTGIYGVGGQQRGIDQVIKDITKNSGLTNAGVLKGARQSGSVTRTRLESMGVPPDMIDMVLDYADSNVAYQKKGGKGMYDPSNKAQRKMMGIEDNFATQAEETARTKEGRDENFYKRQADNYADMEKGIQKVTKALGSLEEALSPLIGKGISTKGGMVRKGLGALSFGLGAAATMTGIGSAAGVPLMMMGGTLMSGDPMPADKKQTSGVSVPMGYSKPANRVPLSQVATASTFAPMNTTFKNRLLQMFAENPNVGIGEGIRSEGTQKQLFLSRYTKVTDGSEGDAEWNGEQYKHTSGAPAAPPGKSMHEIGLAADLVGDLDWVQKNAARFGLKTFGDVNGEPWHIQPAELPNSRWEYEKSGSKWGAPPGTSKGSSGSDTGAYVIGDKYVGKSGSGGAGTYSTFQGMSLSQQISAISAENHQAMGGGSGSDSNSVQSQSTGRTSSSTPQSAGTPPAGTMDPVKLATLMYKRGFRGQHLLNMMAIAGRESAWQPGAYNGVGVDRSYGLFQINMKGSLGPDRLKKIGIQTNEDLFDPVNNIKGAWILGGGKSENYVPWKTEGGPMAKTESWMQKAKVAARTAGVDRGDPMPSGPTRGAPNVQVQGGTNVTIAPNIYVTSSGNSQQDARKMAQEIAQIMERELRKELLRNG
jgi:hypothetical protein